MKNNIYEFNNQLIEMLFKEDFCNKLILFIASALLIGMNDSFYYAFDHALFYLQYSRSMTIFFLNK